jgi:hypothetical protein
MAVPVLPLIALGVSAAGTAGKLWSAFKGSSERRLEVREQLRRFEAGAQQTLGSTRAAGAAAGIEFDSRSLQDYLGEMASEFRQQAEWMRRAARTGDRLGRQGAVLDALTGFGGAFLTYGAQSNWWGPASPGSGSSRGGVGAPSTLPVASPGGGMGHGGH